MNTKLGQKHPKTGLTLDEFEHISSLADGAHLGAAVVVPPDIHRFEIYGASGSLETEKVRACFFAKGLPFVAKELDLAAGGNFDPNYARIRLVGLGQRVPYDACRWDGCKWDPFGATTMVDRQERRVIVNAGDIVEYMDRESCHAFGMYVDEHTHEAGKNSILEGRRKVWGWPVKWTFERIAMVRRQTRKVDELPLESLWFCGAARPPHVARFFAAPAHGAAQIAALRDHLRNGVECPLSAWHGFEYPDVKKKFDAPLREHYERELERRTAFWGGARHDAATYADAVEKVRRLIRDLDEDLTGWRVGGSKPGKNGGEPEPQGPWLGGDKLSVADAYWHVACVRLTGLGLGRMFDTHESTAAYSRRLLHQESLRKATYLWLGRDAFPLPALEPLVRAHGGRLAAERHRLAVLKAAGANGDAADVARAVAGYASRGGFGSIAFVVLVALLAWAGRSLAGGSSAAARPPPPRESGRDAADAPREAV